MPKNSVTPEHDTAEYGVTPETRTHLGDGPRPYQRHDAQGGTEHRPSIRRERLGPPAGTQKDAKPGHVDSRRRLGLPRFSCREKWRELRR